MNTSHQTWIDRIQSLEVSKPIRIMNVCGGHERRISLSGMRSVLPEKVEIIPGPGCPVCVCPEETLHQAIRIGLDHDVTVLTFGDMLYVPTNAPKNEPRSLHQARIAGADIRPIASPQEAVSVARAEQDKYVVFLVAGFETTMAPIAAMLMEGIPDNLLLLLAARLTQPAVRMLLSTGQAAFDALIAPGHVATIMGPEEWKFVVNDHNMPAAIAGFTSGGLLAAIYSVLRQTIEHKPFLDNCYTQLVRPRGNALARRWLNETMNIVPAAWRGIGIIPDSGYNLRATWQHHDARHIFPAEDGSRRRAGQMPPGCDCSEVLLGKLYPDQCRLYGKACLPRNPVGPCMVSEEGACRIWWNSGRRSSGCSE
ncbi:hydrogenase formation protein HypD [Acidihalobacter prosperus]